MRLFTLAAALAMLAAPALAELPDLGGREVSGRDRERLPAAAVRRPEDRRRRSAGSTTPSPRWRRRLNFKPVIVNMSWDAMIPAVSDGQADIGMTGITIRDDRKEKVDFSDPYMRSEMRMLVRADEDRFTDAARASPPTRTSSSAPRPASPPSTSPSTTSSTATRPTRA